MSKTVENSIITKIYHLAKGVKLDIILSIINKTLNVEPFVVPFSEFVEFYEYLNNSKKYLNI